MADVIRGRTNKADIRYLADFNGIVCNKSVSTLDKFNRRFTLTNSAFTCDEYPFTINFKSNSVTGDSRCKIQIQEGYQARHEI